LFPWFFPVPLWKRAPLWMSLDVLNTHSGFWSQVGFELVFLLTLWDNPSRNARVIRTHSTPRTPVWLATKLARHMCPSFLLWICWATGSLTLHMTFWANPLQRSTNSWGTSFFASLAVWSLVKCYWSVCTCLNLSLNTFLNLSHVVFSAWSSRLAL
jgi:hypothetical protein